MSQTPLAPDAGSTAGPIPRRSASHAGLTRGYVIRIREDLSSPLRAIRDLASELAAGSAEREATFFKRLNGVVKASDASLETILRLCDAEKLVGAEIDLAAEFHTIRHDLANASTMMVGNSALLLRDEQAEKFGTMLSELKQIKDLIELYLRRVKAVRPEAIADPLACEIHPQFTVTQDTTSSEDLAKVLRPSTSRPAAFWSSTTIKTRWMRSQRSCKTSNTSSPRWTTARRH
ncbi:MAG: hypothetical protein QM811_27665 [Pirellulales bacterium]